MCGIAGVFCFHNPPCPFESSVDSVGLMVDALRHRGPDGSGVIDTRWGSLGMCRLAIVGGALGAQPQQHRGMWCVFNGEIYDVAARPVDASSAGDPAQTELSRVCEAYVGGGGYGFNDLDGMFSVAIFDPVRERLILARDRFGEKPLFYAQVGDHFAFASEIQALHAGLPELPAGLCAVGVSEFLQFGFCSDAQLMEGVKQVPPGSWISVDLASGQVTSASYTTRSLRQAKSDPLPRRQFDSLLRSAVTKRVQHSDLPVATFLSGGLDSSVMAALAYEAGVQHAFTVHYEGFVDSEAQTARSIGEFLGMNVHEVIVERESFREVLDQSIAACDSPIADSANVGFYALAQETAKSFKVALSGEGADELLGGYDLNRLAARELLYSMIRAPLRFFPRAHTLPNSYAALRGVFISNAFKPEELVGAGRDEPLNAWFQRYGGSGLSSLLGVYESTWLPNNLLARADRLSMAHGLEVRAPYLDKDLSRWVAGQKLYRLVRPFPGNRQTKLPLRNLHRRIFQGQFEPPRKLGFVSPTLTWLAADHLSAVQETILEDLASLSPYIDVRAVVDLLRKSHPNTPLDRRLWTLYYFSRWRKLRRV